MKFWLGGCDEWKFFILPRSQPERRGCLRRAKIPLRVSLAPVNVYCKCTDIATLAALVQSKLASDSMIPANIAQPHLKTGTSPVTCRSQAEQAGMHDRLRHSSCDVKSALPDRHSLVEVSAEAG